MKVGLCDFHVLCVSVNPPLLTFECLNQSLWNLVYTVISWNLSPSERHTLQILVPPIRLCLCM
jgi:hypothetical protein